MKDIFFTKYFAICLIGPICVVFSILIFKMNEDLLKFYFFKQWLYKVCKSEKKEEKEAGQPITKPNSCVLG